MTGRPLSVTEAARHFSDYLNQVLYRGEQFVLMRGKRPVAILAPAPRGVQLDELPALLAHLPHLPPGDADSFSRDIDDARTASGQATGADPWAS